MKSNNNELVGHVAHMEESRVHTGFWWGDLGERDHMEYLNVRESKLKLNLQELGWRDMDWIDIIQNRESSRTLVNAGMNIQARELRSSGLLRK